MLRLGIVKWPREHVIVTHQQGLSKGGYLDFTKRIEPQFHAYSLAA